MIIPEYAKCCLYTFIGASLLGLCVASEIEMPANKAALEFAHQWLANPKMYVGLMLPNKYLFGTNNAVKLIKKLNSDCEGRNAYFIADSNITKYDTILHPQNELIWYPYNIDHYDMDCNFLDSSRYKRLSKKHFLFLYENKETKTFSFETCKIRFDSRLVIYRQTPNNQTIVQFEEIYKIDENDNRL